MPEILPWPRADISADEITASWSEINAYRHCPHKHELQYLERWSKVQPDHTALGKGTLWHYVLEAHYLQLMEGKPTGPLIDQMLGQWRKEGRDPETLELLEWMYSGYLSMWGLDPDWEIIAVEYPFVFPLVNREGVKTRFRLKGKIDLIVRYRPNGRVFCVDHKSCSVLPNQKELDLDDQFGLYLWGLRQIGHKPFGAIYSAARTKMNVGDAPGALEKWERAKAAGEKPGARPKVQELSARFSRDFLTRTDPELDEIAFEALATVEQMYSPVNQYQRHPDTDQCKWKCGMLEACLLGRKTGRVRERQFLEDTGWRQNFTRH